MNAYIAARALHVVGALGLFVALGVDAVGLYCLSRATTVRDIRTAIAVSSLNRFVGPPSLLLMLGPAIYATRAAGFGYGTPWIDLGAASLLVIVLLGAAVTRRKIAAIEGDIPTDEAVSGAPERLFARARDRWLTRSLAVRGSLLFAIAVLMILKPDLAGSSAIVGIAAVAGLLMGAIPKDAKVLATSGRRDDQ